MDVHFRPEQVIRVSDDLALEVKRGRLLVRCGRAEAVVFPGEIRHLVNALAEAAGRLVDLNGLEG